MKTKAHLVIILCGCLWFTLTACSSAHPSSNPTNSVPPEMTFAPTTFPTDNSLPATPTSVNLVRADPGEGKRPTGSAKDCALLTDGDVAGFFSAEVLQPIHGAGSTQRVIFAPQRVSAVESYCIYQAYHLSGSASGRYYQVTYWVDKPDQAAAGQWTQVWTDAQSKAAQAVSSIGEAAFYDQGRLTFKKSNTYVTVEVIATKMDTNTQAGQSEQLEIEKRIALKALSRLE